MIVELLGVRNYVAFLKHPVPVETLEDLGYYCLFAVAPNHPHRKHLLDLMRELVAKHHNDTAARGITTGILGRNRLGSASLSDRNLFITAVAPSGVPLDIQGGDRIQAGCYVNVVVKPQYVIHEDGTDDFAFTLVSVSFHGFQDPYSPLRWKL